MPEREREAIFGIGQPDEEVAAPGHAKTHPCVIAVVDELVDACLHDVFTLVFGRIDDYVFRTDREHRTAAEGADIDGERVDLGTAIDGDGAALAIDRGDGAREPVALADELR